MLIVIHGIVGTLLSIRHLGAQDRLQDRNDWFTKPHADVHGMFLTLDDASEYNGCFVTDT